MEPENYPWWSIVEGNSLAQGDLLQNFEIITPIAPSSEDEVGSSASTFDVLVLTQSCDLEQNKARSVLLCPWWDMWEFVEKAKAQGENWGSKIKDELRKGNLPGYHLLNEAATEKLSIGLGIADFRTLYTAPADFVREFARKSGPRLRLMPPYREHLAQAFARFIMRVGLPVDIPTEKLRSPASET